MKPAELFIHTQLKRCLVFLMFIIIPYNSFAVNACVSNDSVAVVLDATKGNGSSYDRSTPSFKVAVYMPYGTLYGVAACLSGDFGTTGANEETLQMGIYTDNNGVLIDNGSVVVGGENNGSYCWCRITFPVVSNWVYIAGPSWYQKVNTPCAQECNADCGWHIANYSQKRKRLFNLLQN